MVEEPPTAFCRALHVLAQQTEDDAVCDHLGQTLHQQGMVDGGIEGLHVSAQDEAVAIEMPFNESHSLPGPAMPLHMGAPLGDWQDIRQRDGQGLQHQCVARRPQVDVCAVCQCNPVKQAEAEPARPQVILQTRLYLQPVATEVPDIGVIGIVPASPAEPVIGGIQHGVGGQAVNQHHPTIGDGAGRVNSEMREVPDVRIGS